jgi:3-phenylpropionate/cinnamic acid dioxygenase small subunit
MSTATEGVVAVLVRYARAIDTKDWALLRACFTDNATSDYGDIGSWRGVDDVVRFMRDAHAGMGPTQHLLSNFQVAVDGDRASSVAYVVAVAVLASDPQDWIKTIGIYEDRLVRVNDNWLINERTFRVTRTVLSPSLTPSPRRSAEPAQ